MSTYKEFHKELLISLMELYEKVKDPYWDKTGDYPPSEEMEDVRQDLRDALGKDKHKLMLELESILSSQSVDEEFAYFYRGILCGVRLSKFLQLET